VTWNQSEIHTLPEHWKKALEEDCAEKRAEGSIFTKREEDDRVGSALEHFIKKKRIRAFMDVLWPVMFHYNKGCLEYLGPCRVKCVAFDGVWLSNEEVFKLVCYCPAVRMAGFFRPVVTPSGAHHCEFPHKPARGYHSSRIIGLGLGPRRSVSTGFSRAPRRST
jgi:hypothetical protein